MDFIKSVFVLFVFEIVLFFLAVKLAEKGSGLVRCGLGQNNHSVCHRPPFWSKLTPTPPPPTPVREGKSDLALAGTF